MLNQVFETNEHSSFSSVIVKTRNQINRIQGLIIPGGESSTISRFLQSTEIHTEIIERVGEQSLAVMGTCAGCVLMGKRIIGDPKNIMPLQIMDMTVERNAFGRQKESCEQSVEIFDFTSPFPAVFIRAPIIKRVRGQCQIRSKVHEGIIMAQQGIHLAVSFHPELTNDNRIHQLFLDLVKKIQ